jgi:hypothetical protein
MVKFNSGGSVDDHDLAGSNRPSKYDDLLVAVCALNHKQTLVVDREGGDLENQRLCIRQALNRYVPDDVRRIKRFEVRRTGGFDSKIVIICIIKSREG